MTGSWKKASATTIKHSSGNWQIAKYASSPIYVLFDLRGDYAAMAACGDDLDEMKGMVKHDR